MKKIEYFIGGGADKNDYLSKLSKPSNIMNRVKNFREKSKDIECFYRGHEEEKEILKEIKKVFLLL